MSFPTERAAWWLRYARSRSMPRSTLPSLLGCSLALLACRRDRTPPARALASEADAAPVVTRFTGEAPTVRAELGALTFSLTQPGDYASTVDYASQYSRSKEVSESSHAHGVAMLTLDARSGEGGAAHGCFFADATSHVWISTHTKGGGAPSESNDVRTTRLGARGRWRVDAQGWAIVELTATGAACPPPASAQADGESISLRCVGAARGGVDSASALLCSEAKTALRDLALPLGANDEAWLWLAAAPGAAIAFERKVDDVTLQLSAAHVAFDAADWK